MSGIKRTAADKNFSDAVRGASDFVCQRCGIDGKHNKGMMDCSHIYSRKHRGLRWHPLNALCLCRSCHAKIADAPTEHAELVKKLKGEDEYWMLFRERGRVAKIPKAMEKDISKHYLAEVRRIQARRNAGFSGYVEIECWLDALL